MPSNVETSAGSGGAIFTTKQRSHDGDTSQQQGVFLSGVSGTEDSYTFVDVQAGNGTAANALRVTLASDSTGIVALSATDNAVLDAIEANTDGIEGLLATIDADTGGILTAVQGTLTVDATGQGDVPITLDGESVAVTNAGLTALNGAISGSEVQIDAVTFPATVHSADFDSGAGTDNTLSFGIAVPASGGAAVVPGDATTGLKVDLGADNDVTISGTVTVDATGQGDVPVALSAVDNAVLDSMDARLTTIDSDTGAMLTALQLIDDAIYADDDDWTDTTSRHMLVGGLYQSTPQTITDGDVGPLQVDENGNLQVNIVSGAGSGGTASADDADFTAGTTSGTPAMGVYESSPTSVTDGDMGIVGITQNRELKVNVSSGGISGVAEDSAYSGGEDGVPIVGVRRDTAASGVGTDGDFAFLSLTSDGSARVAASPQTSGGLSTFRSIDLDETEEQIKATAGQIFTITAYNTTDAPLYLRLYNATAASVTVGTTTPTHTFVVPGNANSDGSGFVLNIPYGWTFDTAITAACTTGVADNDTGAPGANACVVNIGYA